MKFNPNCARDILLYLQENIYISETEHNTFYIYQLYKPLNQYLEEDILYNAIKLYEEHYITGELLYMADRTVKNFLIDDITIKGHDFVEITNDPSRWEQCQNIAKSVSSFTLASCGKIATGLATVALERAIFHQ